MTGWKRPARLPASLRCWIQTLSTDVDGGTSQTSETATVADAALTWVGGSTAPNSPPTWNQTFEPAPSLTTPAGQSTSEGTSVHLQVQASDADGDTLTPAR